MVDDSIKFAWAFLLIHGKLTNGKWSYYGGCWEEADNRYSSYEVRLKERENLREKVLSVGIDWGKTDIPKVEDESVFNGTFSDSTECLATLGKLVLLNGETFLIGSNENEAAHLVETARQMLDKNNSDVQDLARKI